MSPDRLQQQIQFILEIDKLKSVLRRSYLLNPERRENSAEHSWHVAVMAVLLAEYVSEPVDLPRVLKMLLVHDMVEIDAGDTFAYDPAGARDQAERERRAAERLFKLLPPDQAGELRGLWDEFEAHVTLEAKFARAVDHLMPLLHNYYTQGKSWQEHGVSSAQVLSYNADIEDGSAKLWELAQSLITDAVARGYLAP